MRIFFTAISCFWMGSNLQILIFPYTCLNLLIVVTLIEFHLRFMEYCPFMMFEFLKIPRKYLNSTKPQEINYCAVLFLQAEMQICVIKKYMIEQHCVCGAKLNYTHILT